MDRSFIKINRWSNPLLVQAPVELSEGDVIIAEADDGIFSAIIQSQEADKDESKEERSGTVKFLRKASLNDLKIIRENQKKEKEFLKVCRAEVKKMNLAMKVVDAACSFDRGGVTFAFIADGRIDFRELVKNISKKLQRSIRLHQVGARDESRQGGGYGICGRELCCVKFKGNLPSITSEMAKIQQIAHRGSERISGICGRLMCCLSFEFDQYRKTMKEYPPIGSEVNYEGKKGILKDINIMAEEVKIELEDKSVIFVNKNKLK